MQGMDGGPWTDLGTLGWFVGVWVVMMAAMMFPSVAPTVALYSVMTRHRSPGAPLLFTSGYLLTWSSIGVLAFVIATAGGRVSGDLLAWDRGGRWVAAATLIACGNSICGNSAIAAAAPAIGAKPEDVAASIAFTAVLGVVAVLLMPFLPQLLGLDATQYGIFAGLTVYAVPQVLAATAPLGAIAVQTGTIVKLIRVLMLGPVIASLSVIHGQSGTERLRLQQMVPWFIIAFVLMIMARSFGLIPEALIGPVASLSNILTIMSMAALGLSVDIRSLRHAGGKVIIAASLSLVLLGVLSFGLILLTQTT